MCQRSCISTPTACSRPIRPPATSPAGCTTRSRELPIISPHGHVAPTLLLDDEPFSDPADLLITHDHYVTRLLHAAGVDLADARRRAAARPPTRAQVWRTLREQLAPASPAPRRATGSTHELVDAVRHRGRALGRDRRRALRPDRRAARPPRVPPARAVRPLRHRGARHHRRPDGRPRRARRARRRPGVRRTRAARRSAPTRTSTRPPPASRDRDRAAHRGERRRTRRLRRLPRRARGATGALHRARRRLGRPRRARAVHRRPEPTTRQPRSSAGPSRADARRRRAHVRSRGNMLLRRWPG